MLNDGFTRKTSWKQLVAENNFSTSWKIHLNCISNRSVISIHFYTKNAAKLFMFTDFTLTFCLISIKFSPNHSVSSLGITDKKKKTFLRFLKQLNGVWVIKRWTVKKGNCLSIHFCFIITEGTLHTIMLQRKTWHWVHSALYIHS